MAGKEYKLRKTTTYLAIKQSKKKFWNQKMMKIIIIQNFRIKVLKNKLNNSKILKINNFRSKLIKIKMLYINEKKKTISLDINKKF